jgi:serine/threonine-protein kinase HipA
MNPVIEVVIELEGEPLVVGTLWTRRKQGREGASFAYSEQWLQHPQRFALEPALQLGPGVMHTPGNKALLGRRSIRGSNRVFCVSVLEGSRSCQTAQGLYE